MIIINTLEDIGKAEITPKELNKKILEDDNPIEVLNKYNLFDK